MKIRKATLEDLNNNLIKLYIDGFKYHLNGRPDIFKNIDENKLKNDIKSKIECNDNILVILENDNIIGYVIYKFDEKHDKIMWIDQLIIDEDYRKKGYGKKLIEEIEKIAKDGNCIRIEFSCWSFNDNAILMYKHIGYKEQRVIFEKDIDV